ncbi:MAG: hypothetical protein ABW168_22850 [Sedimenticola sp.]
MASVSIDNLNESVRCFDDISEVIYKDDFQEMIHELSINWNTGRVNENSKLILYVNDKKYIERKNGALTLTRLGKLFFGRICIDFTGAVHKSEIIDGKYKISKLIKEGKNSATFIAEHNLLSHKLVLKFIRPGAGVNVLESLSKVTSDIPQSNLVNPVDFFQHNIIDIFGNDLIVDCVVFPYIEGTTLREFIG